MDIQKGMTEVTNMSWIFTFYGMIKQEIQLWIQWIQGKAHVFSQSITATHAMAGATCL